MVASTAERRRYTLPEFLALADDLGLAGSNEWYEIIEGEAPCPAPCSGHFTFIGRGGDCAPTA